MFSFPSFVAACLHCGLAMCAQAKEPARERPIVIAHRGASAYLPEHTLAAKAMAHAMGADYIEQDVVLTKDDVPVVLHDVHLDAVTDVAQIFPDRKRDDGRYYAIDFSLEEIRRLSVHERIDLKTGKPVFPGRFPQSKLRFSVPTLAEELELIQGLNRSTARNVGIYTEIKSPAWHRKQGKDVSRIVLDLLAKFGYRDKTDNAFVQCFDPAETARIRKELRCRLKLVQLIGENDWKEARADFDKLRTPAGLKEIATCADGIGPWLPHVVSFGKDGKPRVTSLVRDAHAVGLVVHPYTLRADALPQGVDNFDALLRALVFVAEADGAFTDHPDRAVRFLKDRFPHESKAR